MHIIFLLLIFFLPKTSQNEQTRILLQAKAFLSDPQNSLSTWTTSQSSPCEFAGITCSNSGEPTAVNLPSASLSGRFPSPLCQLRRLSVLSLSSNSINSSLTAKTLEKCNAVRRLDLSLNYFYGELPDSLPEIMPELRYLDLSSNYFSGSIPASFGRFKNLRSLSLVGNSLSGAVPAFLGDVVTLRELNLSYNSFSPSPIPATFGNLTALRNLWLSNCNLVGEIPKSLGRLSELRNLDISTNSIVGSIPESFSGLKSIVQLELYSNFLTGALPNGLSNLTELRFFDVAMNRLTGEISAAIFDGGKLESFHVYENNLTGGVPSVIADCKNLVDIRLFSNKLVGALPANLGKNSPLSFIDVSDNWLSGEIPSGICDGGVLEQLLLINNEFTGHLPESLGSCRWLIRVRLSNNRLSGEVPPEFWGLPHMSLLDIGGNEFYGGISLEISKASNLTKLLISDNQFSGPLPEEIGALLILSEISAENNRLTGPLPLGLRKLSELEQLDLHNNSIGGEMLGGIKLWGKLTLLNLANNELSGEIPGELGSLPVLNYLDLSSNKLTGVIPVELQNLKLNQFNLSDNQLIGRIPPLLASEAYQNSFLDNPGLCLNSAGICSNGDGDGKRHHWYVWLLRSVVILASFVLFTGATLFYWRHKNYKQANIDPDKPRFMFTSFQMLGFDEYEILSSLDEDNVIGIGASGKVYKVVLSNKEIVAVKKLWEPSTKQKDNRTSRDEFETEVAVLGKIRHKNIVKLFCCCIYRDSKLLVYEYMQNGSLADMLHSNKSDMLNWPMRYKIALDAAEGLSYLHHDCVPPIIHRDIKSSNVLLDTEFAAKLADFGVAKAIGKGPKSMSVIAGSCGYIAPEYAYTLRVTEKSDIYSFGVTILELVTGRPPIDPESEVDLVKWVCCTMEKQGMENLLDSKLDTCYREEICKVLRIGLLCTSSLPINRPSMKRVVKMLREVVPDNIPVSEKKDPCLSPYYLDDVSDTGSTL